MGYTRIKRKLPEGKKSSRRRIGRVVFMRNELYRDFFAFPEIGPFLHCVYSLMNIPIRAKREWEEGKGTTQLTRLISKALFWQYVQKRGGLFAN